VGHDHPFPRIEPPSGGEEGGHPPHGDAAPHLPLRPQGQGPAEALGLRGRGPPPHHARADRRLQGGARRGDDAPGLHRGHARRRLRRPASVPRQACRGSEGDELPPGRRAVRHDRSDGARRQSRRLRQPVHRPRGGVVHRLLDGRAGAAEAPERRGLRHHVPELRPARQAVGPVQLRLSLRRRGGGRADGRWRAHLAVGADRPLHRHDRRGLGVQGRLRRQARAQVRLRRRIEQRPPRVHLADREPDDGRHGGVDGARRIRPAGRRGPRDV
ncbi:MAG: hypothetical protein AVDCRST_MAG08-2480, partial [uncultured Acetobacteraceae bacterium]